jgi:hypothetical protein
MHEKMRQFELLAAIARNEAPPAVDVTHRVLATLRAEEAAFEGPLVLFAAGSAAAATAVFALSLPLLFTYLDPLGALIQTMAQLVV